ncbi:tetratricopeptide repeat protein [Rhizorhabdus phycosphaerae]|uniref:tetratricopeptide repeat protein n=1 Tax=Rhizorhabdus phycosphaerae TaxID=2711156 RepID=UPI0013ED6C5B|nr:YbgF trimerization domain-containing protein [Rhizorhabdus phycosphaerae]
MKKAMIALLLVTVATPALAQQSMPVEKRVDKLEKEIKAVQRKVFPGGAQTYFEPEIKPQAAAPAPAGSPADAPLVDLSRRVDALEKALAAMTGQVEQNSYNLRKLEDQFAKMKGDTEFRLNTLEGKAPAASGPATGGASLPYVVPPAPKPGAPAATPPAATTPAAAPVATPPSGNPGKDAYMAGYDLWMAKKYPEAIAALKAMYAKYPKDKYASYARNLAGRAYLDSGQYNEAIREFFENTKIEDGERAPHSYVFMAEALMKRKPPLFDKACQAYDVLSAKYPDQVTTGPLAQMVAKGRTDAKCK